ncbi:MAG: protein kinase [Polyangiaceae bacterium]
MDSAPPSSATGIGAGVVVDRYEILAPLGRGAFGHVYRARHMHTRQEVALKVLRSRPAQDPRSFERLVREARVMASIRHPNIVAVYDCGVAEGRAFVTMELVSGRTLEDIIFEDGPLTLDKAIPLSLQLLDGLGAAHERGVIHRDIKPANMLVTADGTLKILDFGISRADADGPLGPESQVGMFVGTPGFMAPEQYALGRIDARVDLYAAAVTIFCALTARTPFDLDLPLSDLAAKVMHERPPRLDTLVPGLPQTFVDAIDRGLARDADARFPDAHTFRRALLGDAVAFSPTVASRPGSSGPAPDPSNSAFHPTAMRPSATPGGFGSGTPVPLGSGPPPAFSPTAHHHAASAPPPGDPNAPTLREAKPASSPAWILAGVVVGALVLVIGAVGGAVVMEARAKREAQEKQASAAASTPAPQGSAVRELAKEGIYINPPTIEKTGTFTTTQICSGPNDLKFTKATFTVQDGPAILVQGGCEVTVIDSQIRAPVGIRITSTGSARVSGGAIVAQVAGIDHDGDELTLADTRVEAPTAVSLKGGVTAKIRKTQLLGRAFGLLGAAAVRTELTDVTITGITAVSIESGHLVANGGTFEGTTYSVDASGISEVDLTRVELKGPTRTRDLAKINQGVAAPPKPGKLR